MRRRPGTGAGLACAGAALLWMLTGCGGGGSNGTRVAPATTPSADSSVSRLETFASITIPSTAQQLAVESRTNGDGEPVYTSHFGTTPDGARAFCAANGFGGQLPWLDGLGPETRSYYKVTGDSVERPFGCRASSPKDPQVQRDVLVTLPTPGTATVYLVAYRMPR